MKHIIIVLSAVVIFGSSYAPTLYAAGSMVTKDEEIKLLKEQIVALQKQVATLQKRIEKSSDSDESDLSDAEKLEILKVRKSDHVRGDLTAPVVLVTYTDFESPFSKTFHDTLLKIYREYGRSGDVLWVQRNFPIDALYPNSARVAGASECVAHLNGNDAYWKFADKVFSSRNAGNINKTTDITKLASYAKSAGADSKKIKKCFTQKTYEKDARASYDEGMRIGVRGAPQTAVVYDGDLTWIMGSQPYDTIKEMLEVQVGSIQE
jgi:protein-disulfide isomerase